MGTMNNTRAEWAQKALDAFPAKEDGQTRQNIEDLICDLGHLLMISEGVFAGRSRGRDTGSNRMLLGGGEG